MNNQNLCICGSNKSYRDCCEPLHLGQETDNLESLMRSRYTAFAMEKYDYLVKTWLCYKSILTHELSL